MHKLFGNFFASATAIVGLIALTPTPAFSQIDITFGGFVDPDSPVAASGFGIFSYSPIEVTPSSTVIPFTGSSEVPEFVLGLSNSNDGLVLDRVLTSSDLELASGVVFDRNSEFDGLVLEFPVGFFTFEGSEPLGDLATFKPTVLAFSQSFGGIIFDTFTGRIFGEVTFSEPQITQTIEGSALITQAFRFETFELTTETIQPLPITFVETEVLRLLTTHTEVDPKAILIAHSL